MTLEDAPRDGSRLLVTLAEKMFAETTNVFPGASDSRRVASICRGSFAPPRAWRSITGPVARLYLPLPLFAPNLVHPVSLLYGHACEGTQSLTSLPQELLSIVRKRLMGGTGPGQCVAHRTLTTLLTFASSAHSRAMSHEENSPII